MTVGNFLQHDVLFLLQLSFPVLQNLGTLRKKPIGHWYMLSVNFAAKRFEVLDSLRGDDDVGLIEHASKLIDAIKEMYRINYSDSRRQIDDFELMYIPVPKQTNGLVFFRAHYHIYF